MKHTAIIVILIYISFLHFICQAGENAFMIQINSDEKLSIVGSLHAELPVEVSAEITSDKVEDGQRLCHFKLFYSREVTQEERGNTVIGIVVDDPLSPMLVGRTLAEYKIKDLRENVIKIQLVKGTKKIYYPEVDSTKHSVRMLAVIESCNGYENRKIVFVNKDNKGFISVDWESSCPDFNLTLIPFARGSKPDYTLSKTWQLDDAADH